MENIAIGKQDVTVVTTDVCILMVGNEYGATIPTKKKPCLLMMDSFAMRLCEVINDNPSRSPVDDGVG